MNPGHEKSEDRLAIEAVLQYATPANPLSVHDIAAQADIDIKRVRNVMSTIVFEQGAYSCVQSGRTGSLYARGPKPAAPKSDNLPAPRTAPPSGEYKPKPWNVARGEAAQRAFELGSMHCGTVIPRVRPAIIAGRALEPAVMRGGVQ